MHEKTLQRIFGCRSFPIELTARFPRGAHFVAVAPASVEHYARDAGGTALIQVLAAVNEAVTERGEGFIRSSDSLYSPQATAGDCIGCLLGRMRMISLASHLR